MDLKWRRALHAEGGGGVPPITTEIQRDGASCAVPLAAKKKDMYFIAILMYLYATTFVLKTSELLVPHHSKVAYSSLGPLWTCRT